MNALLIAPIKGSLYQNLTLFLKIGEDVKRVVLELRYFDKTDRWYMSLYDVQKEHTYILNAPILTSDPKLPNNLWMPFYHKSIGMFFCFPKSEVSTENPTKDNLSDFYLIWSDGLE